MPEPPSRPQKASSSVYKVPRRFDLATVFVVTSTYALSLGVMRSVDIPMAVQGSIIGLLTVVGFVQMLVPARHVRTAAILCGVVLVIGPLWALELTSGRPFHASRLSSLLCSALTFGSLLGYCAGVVVAGIFLLSDYVRKGSSWLWDYQRRSR